MRWGYDKKNCFMPKYSLEEITECALIANAYKDRQDIIDNAYNMAKQHSLKNERKLFVDILDRVEELWT